VHRHADPLAQDIGGEQRPHIIYAIGEQYSEEMLDWGWIESR
jgi:hypothetical protein